MTPDKIQRLVSNVNDLSKIAPSIQHDFGALLSKDTRLASLSRVEALSKLLGDFKDIILNIEEDFKILTNKE